MRLNLFSKREKEQVKDTRTHYFIEVNGGKFKVPTEDISNRWSMFNTGFEAAWIEYFDKIENKKMKEPQKV